MNPFNDQIGTESERIELATSQLVFRKNSSIEFVQEEVIFENKMHSTAVLDGIGLKMAPSADITIAKLQR